ncbi:MAG: class I SAM-dependent methyltransferase [Tepidiformaceae bacterium]
MSFAQTFTRYRRAAMYRLLLLNYGRARRWYWELRTPDLHERWNGENADFPVLSEVIRAHQAESVLDLGCGSGRLFPVYEGAALREVLGVDIAARALSLAAKLHPTIPTLRSRAEDLPLDRPFDLIVVHRVLQHLPPQTLPAVLDRVCRIARKAIYINEIGASDHANLSGARYMFEHDYASLFSARGWERAESGLVPGTRQTYVVYAPAASGGATA